MARRARKGRNRGHRGKGLAGAGRALAAWARASAARLRAWPEPFRSLVAAVLFAVLAVGVNWGYQVARKPSELWFPVSESLYKDPAQTWRAYGTLFERHATAVMAPTLLAALAQIEGSGNPIVRTYWRFSLTSEPFEIFRPASSAVGMYQITDGTFAIARRYCIRRNQVAEEGPWYDFRSCWLNGLYTRTVPSHAIEMTSAYLDRAVEQVLARHPVPGATIKQKQRLAALAHLCGVGAANEHARRGLTFRPGQRCGSHDARAYVERVATMQRRFEALARG
jgi:hypothetical protein